MIFFADSKSISSFRNCYASHVTRHTSHVTRHAAHVSCIISISQRKLLLSVSYLMHQSGPAKLRRPLSNATGNCMLRWATRVTRVTRHTSHFKLCHSLCHTSHVTRHSSHVTRHTFVAALTAGCSLVRSCCMRLWDTVMRCPSLRLMILGCCHFCCWRFFS